MLVVSGVAAAVGVVIAREFGRTEQTDGLLAAYGVFIVIVVAAQAIRIAVLPALARAKEHGRLAGELAGYAVALFVIAIPLVLAAELGAGTFGRLLTGDRSTLAAETAANTLKWVVPAGVAYLFAGLVASGLAALDDYETAAFGFAAGSIAGLVLIVDRAGSNGIVAVAWGVALNGTIAFVVPAVGLVIRGLRAEMPTRALKPRGEPLETRLRAFGVGAALPIALQLLYVVSLPFAARLGEGAATSFVYAYLAAAAVVTITAGSLGLVTAVPLARADFTTSETVRHVAATSWLALVLVGAAAGALAVAGGEVIGAVLGGAYGGDIGEEVGKLIVVLSPWMIASIGVSVTFPLAFVAERTRRLPWIALGALGLQVPLAWIGASLFGLDGLAAALACSTLAVLVVLLAELEALAPVARRLGAASAVVFGLAFVAFVPPALVLGAHSTAVVGLVLYAALLLLVRPPALTTSWSYLRTLR